LKKPVHSSNLALRFQKRDGWDLETLLKYLKKGTIRDTEIAHGDSKESAYYALNVGSSFYIESLYYNEVSELHRYTNTSETDLQYMERFNP
jgi:hypothetical protein